jgi:hypothetical protein
MMGKSEIEDEIVEKLRRHARLDVFGQKVEGLGRQASNFPHDREGVGAMQFNMAAFAARHFQGVNEGHLASILERKTENSTQIYAFDGTVQDAQCRRAIASFRYIMGL